MARRRKRNRSALESLVDAPATAMLVHGGHEFFDVLLRMIGDAQEELHLQTYIFDHDETGKEVIAALLAAVKRGVRVVVLIDALSQKTSSIAKKWQFSAMLIEKKVACKNLFNHIAVDQCEIYGFASKKMLAVSTKRK